MRRTLSRISRLAWIAGVIPWAAGAQQPAQATTGTITGRIIETGTQRPLSDAQVVVVGTQRGALSNAEGTFRITGVQPGTVTIRAQRIGYSPATQTVAVTANAEATANFMLSPTAIQIDEVVVTATGETQRKRESGVSTALIDTTQVNLAAAPTISSVLSSRTAGVTVQSSGGTTGTSTRIRIRGSNSVNLSNEPLIIVDGVRVNNDPAEFSLGIGGQTISRLEDFNPEDIESFEVIKGPAAAALYGTAAANGVIQITTKKGRSGTPKWNFYEEYGRIEDYQDYPDNWNRFGRNATNTANVQGCTLEREVLRICTPFADSLVSWNPIENVSPFRTGWRQTHGLSANGGSDQATYFLAGEYEREQGVYDVNKLRRYSLRSNLVSQLRRDMQATVTLGYVRNRIQLPYNDNSAFGAIAAGLLGKGIDCSPATYKQITYCGSDSLSRGYFNANIPSTQYFNVTNQQTNDRFTGGLNANWFPTEWLRGVAQGGLDIINTLDEQLFPPGKVFFSQTTLEGSRFQARYRIPSYNLGGSLSATYGIPFGGLEGRTTAGAQYNQEQRNFTSASGAILLPGTASLGGTSARFAVNETNRDVRTVGGFVQQQVSYGDRLFVTAGVRTDRGSTFGEDFGWIAYPTANISWVLSDEAFFPRTNFLSQLRLRAGYGESGQRPAFRQAETYFTPVSVRQGTNEVPAITVGGTGDPTLKPELTREYEAGLEASFFNGRLGLDLTGYFKRTEDALIAQRLAPSLGLSATRLVNLGEVENKGIEALINSTFLDLPQFRWEGTFSVNLTQNRVIDLGANIEPILFGFNSTQQHRNGYPLGAYFERKILSYNDLDGNGIITRVNCPAYGGTANPVLAGGPQCEVVLSDSLEYLKAGPLPTREFTFNTGVTLFRQARLQALFDYRGGFKIFNSTGEFRCTLGTPNCRSVYDKTTPLPEQARTVARLMGSEAGFIEDASFLKLREVALTLSAPNDWARRVRMNALSLTLAGRNLVTWTDYSGLDPEVNSNSGTNFTTSDFLAQPPVRYFTARLNLNF